MRDLVRRKPVLASTLLWVLAVILTLGCFTYQDQTGPTYPLDGEIEVADQVVRFKFARSETIGRGLAIVLTAPVPEGVSGYVEYRRYRSDDPWSTSPLRPGKFDLSRRGREESLQGLGTKLPSLEERAGKYEFFVYVRAGDEPPVSVTFDRPVYARYKAPVPRTAIVVHILMIFASMILAIRTVLEALADGRFRWMLWATIVSLLLGGFVLGPLVQWYAFGVLWAGVPFGYDWTDNKVLLELAAWLLAAYRNRGEHRSRSTVYLAGVVTLLVYFIPHSLFGSEYDYRTGTGHGTAG